jgi:hypothetical protein
MPTRTLAAPATMTVRRVASCWVRFFTATLLASERGIKPQAWLALGGGGCRDGDPAPRQMSHGEDQVGGRR